MEPQSRLQLERAPVEVVLAIMKSLPTFSDLNKLICTSSFFYRLWQENEYGICGAISRKEVGAELWGHFYRLLVQRTELKRMMDINSKPALGTSILIDGKKENTTSVSNRKIGVFAGGRGVGIAGVAQLKLYKEQLEFMGSIFVEENAIRLRSLEEDFPRGRPRPLVFTWENVEDDTSDPLQRVRVTRAFCNFWCIIIAMAPMVLEYTKLCRHYDSLAGRGGEPRRKLDLTVKKLDDSALESCPREEEYIRRFWKWLKFVPHLMSKDNEEELYELLTVVELTTWVNEQYIGKFLGTINKEGYWRQESFVEAAMDVLGGFYTAVVEGGVWFH